MQLELQARIAQRRIESIESVLQSGVQARRSPGWDKETEELIARLYDSSVSEADTSSCISILEMLVLIEGLQPLLNLLKSETFSLRLRQQAARAILVIGSSYVENELQDLRSAVSPELHQLAEIALGIQQPSSNA